MKAKTAKEIIRTTLDIPLELNEKLKAEATANKRSRHGHILFLVEQHFEETKQKGVKK